MQENRTETLYSLPVRSLATLLLLEDLPVLAKPPPLPAASSALSCPSSSADGSGRASWINWSAIVASTSLSFALVVSVVAWIITHPHKAAGLSATPSVAASASGMKSPPQAAIEPTVPAPHRGSVLETTPAVYKSGQRDQIAGRISLLEEAPPPLPPPAALRSHVPPAAVQAAPGQPVGETYGTQVLFLNNQETAAELAKRDHKLLFVMHISGNFEDSCFT